MKKEFFLPEEILALTVGKSVITKSQCAVTIDFVNYFIERVNYHVLSKHKKVEIYSCVNEHWIEHINWNSTYAYDENQKVFVVKENMLYKVFHYWEVAEHRLMIILAEKSLAKLSQSEQGLFHNEACKLMLDAFNETKKNFD